MAAAGALFEEAVAVVLRSWSGLTMAVDNQFGGPLSQQKASWLETVTAQWMRENDNVQCDELEVFLDTLMDQEFDTIFEDGSTAQISRKICELYDKCCHGDEESVQSFVTAHSACPPPPPVTQGDTRSSGEEGEGGEGKGEEEEGRAGGRQEPMEEGVKEEEEEAEEGWQVVKSRRRSRN